MTITFTSFGTHRGSRWSQGKLQFSKWQRRARLRQELQSLSDTTLRDIGLSRCDIQLEAAKPFWMA